MAPCTIGLLTLAMLTMTKLAVGCDARGAQMVHTRCGQCPEKQRDPDRDLEASRGGRLCGGTLPCRRCLLWHCSPCHYLLWRCHASRIHRMVPPPSLRDPSPQGSTAWSRPHLSGIHRLKDPPHGPTPISQGSIASGIHRIPSLRDPSRSLHRGVPFPVSSLRARP